MLRNHSKIHPAPSAFVQGRFTLVEMLVVITIMSILMALLLPVLQSATAMATAMACANNQGNIGVALSQYVMDNQGIFPLYNTFTTTTPAYLKWQDSIAPYAINRAANNNVYITAAGTPYPVFCCPAQTNTPAYAYQQYGINFYVSSAGSYSNRKIQTISAPSKRALVTDCADSSSIISFSEYRNINWRHTQKANILYADWHVASVPDFMVPTTTWMSPFWGQAIR